MQVVFLQALMYPKGFFFCYGKEEQMKHYANKNPKDNAALRKNALNIAISYAKNIFFCIFFPTPPPAHPRVRACTAYPLISFDSQLGCYANPKIEVLKTLSTLRAQILMDSEYIGSATTYCDKKPFGYTHSC